MKVAQQIVRHTAERVSPRLLRRPRVVADREHVGIERVEPRPLAFVGLHLRRAHRRERQRMERHDDVLLATKVREADHGADAGWVERNPERADPTGHHAESLLSRTRKTPRDKVVGIREDPLMRLRSLPGLLLVAAFLLFVVPSAVGFYTDWLWFRELGYEGVFLRTLNAQSARLRRHVLAWCSRFSIVNLRFARRRTSERPQCRARHGCRRPADLARGPTDRRPGHAGLARRRRCSSALPARRAG